MKWIWKVIHRLYSVHQFSLKLKIVFFQRTWNLYQKPPEFDFCKKFSNVVLFIPALIVFLLANKGFRHPENFCFQVYCSCLKKKWEVLHWQARNVCIQVVHELHNISGFEPRWTKFHRVNCQFSTCFNTTHLKTDFRAGLPPRRLRGNRDVFRGMWMWWSLHGRELQRKTVLSECFLPNWWRCPQFPSLQRPLLFNNMPYVFNH